MNAGITVMNYIFIAVTVFLVFCLLFFTRTIFLWLDAKAKETDTNWDDTAERFTTEGIEIPFLEMEDWLIK
jgi:hypothetical protein